MTTKTRFKQATLAQQPVCEDSETRRAQAMAQEGGIMGIFSSAFAHIPHDETRAHTAQVIELPLARREAA